MAVLKAIGVCKRFKIPGRMPVEVLKGVDISVEAGEKVAIIGRSGAGKSTLLHILGGLLKPDRGRIFRASRPGFVFQAYHLMPELTVLENILLPTMARGSSAAAEAHAKELMEMAGLSRRAAHLPAELSGGECQRVAVARALVAQPQIVLADEPTGNLDAMTGADILRMLSGLSGGRTALVMVTHSPEAAAVCDRVLVLRDGRLEDKKDGDGGKAVLRQTVTARLAGLSQKERTAASSAVCAKLLELARTGALGVEPHSGKPLAVYLPVGKEIDIDEFTAQMLEEGASLVAPRWNGRTYDLARLKGLYDACLRRGPMGVREPADADIVAPGDVHAWIVPGLAFSRVGRRLGHGGGWYDRLLAAAPKDATKTAVAYSFQIFDDIPCEPHDIPVSTVVADT